MTNHPLIQYIILRQNNTCMRKVLFIAIIMMLAASAVYPQSYTGYVNPFIGTDGTGHTFPGPSLPFGMVQPGPDCRDTDWNYTSGYQYADTVILGFSQTRLSGTGIGELGDILLLPFAGDSSLPGRLSHTVDKKTEYAEPGYYTVTKKDGVKVELTCTERVAFHRYVFPEGSRAKVLADFRHGIRFLTDSLVLDSDVRVKGKNTIEGYCHTRNWVERKYYFRMVFDSDFKASTVSSPEDASKAPAFVLDFGSLENDTLRVKVALSATGLRGAVKNMKAELDGWDFDAVRRQASSVWNGYLGRIHIEADGHDRTTFYTALYHLLLQPSDIADAGEEEYYSTLSNWDIYRAAFPLLQIVAPERIDGIVRSMVRHSQENGFLPIWTVWGVDNYCMIGNHAIPMIVSAYMNGFRGFDAGEAMDAILQTCYSPHIHSDWETLAEYGYYPYDTIKDESVSKLLENCYDDWCAALLADSLGHSGTASDLYRRASSYLNVFDPVTGLFRGKDSGGKWREPFDPFRATSPMNNPGDYTEANAWQYFWTPAQHDIDGLTELLGGEKALGEKLDAFFGTETPDPDKYLGQEAMVGLYAHGNEPCHHVAYLYAFSDRPHNLEKYVRRIVRDYYGPSPDGMFGNNDCGQMSAWYILSCLGFYPVNPATGEFVLGVPCFRKAVLNPQGEHPLVISAENFSETNIYRECASLNGKTLGKTIKYSDIMKGGELKFRMTGNIQLPFGSIKPLGWLKSQMQYDMDGICTHLPELVPELFDDPIYSSGRLDRHSRVKDLGNSREGDSEGDEQYKWWNSETQSNWRDGFIRNAVLLDDSAAMAEASQYVDAILRTQDGDGYLGIYTPSLRYGFDKENGELWAKTTLMRGLLGYFEGTGDVRVYRAVKAAVDNVTDNWRIGESRPFDCGTEYNGGAAHGLTFTDILKKMYDFTGDRKYLDYAHFLYMEYSSSYSAESDAQLGNILDTAYRLKCHGVHTYELLRPVAVSASVDEGLRDALCAYLDKVETCVTPTGGAIGDEWIGGRSADPETTGYEYCSLQELLDSYTLLLQYDGNPAYAEKAERIFYNAAQGMRHPDRPAVAYLKTDNSFSMDGHRYKYSPVHQDVAVCCVPNAMRISPYFLSSAWMTSPEGDLRLMMFAPCRVDTSVGGNHIVVEEETEYPSDLDIRLSVRCGSPFTLRIRIPEWSTGYVSDAELTEEGRFLVCQVNDGDTLHISFGAEVRTETLAGKTYFAYGPQIYALPLEAVERPGRVYADGYFDTTVEPVDTELRYSYMENHGAVCSDGRMEVTLRNNATGKEERVTLLPLGRTLLRQCAF